MESISRVAIISPSMSACLVVYVWFMTVYETVREWVMTVWRTMRRIYFARTHIHFLYTYAHVTTQTRMHKQKRGGAKIRVTTHTKESFLYLSVCLSIYLSFYSSIHPCTIPTHTHAHTHTHTNTRTRTHTNTHTHDKDNAGVDVSSQRR